MAMAFNHQVVSSKVDILLKQRNYLEEQRNYLQTLVEETNEVLQLATSWLRNADETDNVTFNNINKIVEDKLVFLTNKCTDISGGSEKIAKQQESAPAKSLTTASTCTGQPLLERNNQVSDELKAIVSQVKVIQNAMSFLSTSTERISEKQLIMEQGVETLSVKYSKLEQERMREIETELKNNYEKQTKNLDQHDIRMKSFESKIQAVADIKDNWQKTVIKEQKKEKEKLQKQSEQFTKDLNFVMQNIKELNSRIFFLEDQALISTQLETFDNKVKSCETNSESLSTKFEEHGLLFEEFARRTEETLSNLSSFRGSENERLQKFEEKISALEMNWSETSQEARKLCNDVETKYQMVSLIIADRLAPLERLRDIFKKKLDVRKKNITKLDNICDQMADLLSKVSQLETQKQRHGVGFSAGMPLDLCVNKSIVIKGFTNVTSNIGNHFNRATGVFTAPINGLYATYLYIKNSGAGKFAFVIVKQPCSIPCYCTQCDKCRVGRVLTDIDNQASIFKVVDMKAGETLSVRREHSNEVVHYIVFTCFGIS